MDITLGGAWVPVMDIRYLGGAWVPVRGMGTCDGYQVPGPWVSVRVMGTCEGHGDL